MEDEGIYYWFDAHDKPGTMVLADNSSSAHEPLPATDVLRWAGGSSSETRYNDVSLWTSARRLDTGKYASRDSDFKAIRKKLGAEIDASDDHELANFEEFEFAGGYFTADAGDNLARTRGDELIARRDRHWAVTRWPDGTVGRRFKLEGDEEGARDGEYLIGACTFAVTHPGYEGASSSLGSRSAMDVLRALLVNEAVDGQTMDILEDVARNTPALNAGGRGSSAFVLTVMPAELPFRPARVTPRKIMPGPQSAIVVGPAGEEIHADEFGRVKVHFHWDRYDKSDEKSTCWVRVSQPWAGKGWGAYFIPRIGQEVIVDFLNGDPDRPLVTGRVYNDEQKIPWGSNHTQSGFLSRSTPGGTPGNANIFGLRTKRVLSRSCCMRKKTRTLKSRTMKPTGLGMTRS
jgi:type VI secretion system secreted protein VgrG